MERIKADEPGTWYCVVRIADSHGEYGGRSLSVAAVHLVPGTCYGKGPGLTDAMGAAWAAAWRFRLAARRETTGHGGAEASQEAA